MGLASGLGTCIRNRVEDRIMAIQAQQLSILWNELDLAWSQLIRTCVSVYLSCGWQLLKG